MLKFGGDVVVDWMLLICTVADRSDVALFILFHFTATNHSWYPTDYEYYTRTSFIAFLDLLMNIQPCVVKRSEP